MDKPKRLLVCGGRDFGNVLGDLELLYDFLDQFTREHEVEVIIHGAAPGADYLAGKYAELCCIPVAVYPADWDRYGKAAGMIRNRRMLLEGKPTDGAATPGGRGTAGMVGLLRGAHVPTIELKRKQ